MYEKSIESDDTTLNINNDWSENFKMPNASQEQLTQTRDILDLELTNLRLAVKKMKDAHYCILILGAIPSTISAIIAGWNAKYDITTTTSERTAKDTQICLSITISVLSGISSLALVFATIFKTEQVSTIYILMGRIEHLKAKCMEEELSVTKYNQVQREWQEIKNNLVDIKVSIFYHE